MKICVQGLWHLGSVTAACMASLGHQVVGLDTDHDVVHALQQGQPPILEPGLQDLMKKTLASGHLTFSDDIAAAVQGIDVLWITYDTPVDENDQADVAFVLAQIEHTLVHLPAEVTVLVSSQMPVGSIRHLEKIAHERFPEKRIGFACSPENLRLGKALDVFLKPDRIVVGVRHQTDKNKLEHMLSSITDRIEWMSVESAEMTKHAINAFLAVSVTFANEMAAICELVGADAKEVERGLKSENRIGPKAYLSPGSAFAGGTLARDVAFLNQAVNENKLSTPLLASVKQSNDVHKEWVKRKLLALFPDLTKCAVAVWGLTYKPGTDTLRRSMAVELCDWLIDQRADIRVHDPVVKTLPEAWTGNVKHCRDVIDTLQQAQALVICTEWPEYKDVTVEQVNAAAPGLTVIDTNRFLSSFARAVQLKYVAVGTPS